MPNHTDFNGDGRDDILWRTNGGGAGESLGQLDGSFLLVGPGITLPLNSVVVTTGDFDGNGRDDALLRDGFTGNVSEWLSDVNGVLVQNQAVDYALDFAWNVAGTGDFNHDGYDDVLLRHDNGTVTEWLGGAGGHLAWNAAATYALPLSWHVAGIGDFDGDSHDDVLLRHDNGTVTEWLGQTNGSFFSNHAAATYTLPAGWNVAGTGDFSGDGKDDVLLRHNNGTVTEWLGGTGGRLTWNAAATYALPLNWSVAGIGDFNGGGRDDVLLRDNFGAVTDWLGQAGGTFFSNHSVWTFDFFDWNTAIQPDSFTTPWDY